MEPNTLIVVNLEGIPIDEDTKKQMEKEIRAVAMKYIAAIDFDNKIVINSNLSKAEMERLDLDKIFIKGIIIKNER